MRRADAIKPAEEAGVKREMDRANVDCPREESAPSVHAHACVNTCPHLSVGAWAAVSAQQVSCRVPEVRSRGYN